MAAQASAAIYEHRFDIDDEDDLFDLELRGDVRGDTVETLVQLLREGVDLASAPPSRLFELPSLTMADVEAIVAYRQRHGGMAEPTQLVADGVLTPDQLTQLTPFLKRRAPGSTALPLSGSVRAVSRVTVGDPVAPPLLVEGGLNGPLGLSAGALFVTTRRQLASPSFDPAQGGFVTAGFGYLPQLPRAFAQWRSGPFTVVVGTFAVGFAERLVLDTSRRVAPNGLSLPDDFRRPFSLVRLCTYSPSTSAVAPCGPALADRAVTPDFQHRDTFRGVALSVDDVPLGGEARGAAYAFASYQARTVSQYELFDRRFCADPRVDTDPGCAAPPVWLEGQATRVISSALPLVDHELTVGGHVSLRPTGRVALGVTGTWTAPFVEEPTHRLDFQEWSRFPSGGPFGVLGVDASVVAGAFAFFLEGARSFASADGGGWGVVQRSTWDGGGHHLELAVRAYDAHFATPFGRPISAPDELDGQRARNEVGGRLHYLAALSPAWAVRVWADVWVNPTEASGQPAGTPNVFALARADYLGARWVRPSVWVEVRDRNLASTTLLGCGAASFSEGEVGCNGDRVKLVGRVEGQVDPRWLRVAAQGAVALSGGASSERPRTDVMLWLEARSRPLEQLELRLKSRYLDQDVASLRSLETTWWTGFDVAWVPRPMTRVAGRAELLVWLDQRASTQVRAPNPALRFSLDVSCAF